MIEGATDWVLLIGSLATAARIIVTLTPTKKDDNILIKLLRICERLGLPDVKAKKKVSKKVKKRK